MGRLATLVAAVSSALLIAQPSGTPSPSPEPVEVPEAVPGEEQCTIADQRLVELSGIVALGDQYAVANDLTDFANRQGVFLLDGNCQVQDRIMLQSGQGGPNDPEDLAYDPEEEVLWVADTGDNQEIRQTVALWRIDLAGDRIPEIHRFAYPDGARDAETLILDGDGTPLIVSRTMGTPSGIYRPASEMVANNPHEQAVPLERVAQFEPPDTGAEHNLGRAARLLLTGGATAPDGDRVVLRTYTDAYEFDVTDGDVAGAIDSGEYRITPLPDEPWGEAITYTPDGEHFLTVSETFEIEDAGTPTMLRYTPTEPAPDPPPESAGAQEPASDDRSLLDTLGPQGILNIIAGIGGVGLIMATAGVIGIVRARRRQGGSDEAEPDGEGGDPEGGPVAARARVMPVEPPGEWLPDLGNEEHGPPPDDRPAPGAAGPPRPGTVYSAGGSAANDMRQPEHPFDQDQPSGYPDRGRDHRHPEHGHPDSGHPGPGHPGPGHAGPGHAGPGRPDPRNDQGGAYQGGAYRGGAYQGGGYQGGGQPGGGYQGGRQPAGPPHGGPPPPHPGQPQPGHPPGAAPAGGVYGARPEEVPDYYYDDPDYEYEFRDREQW